MAAAFDLQVLTVSDPITSAKGAKTSALSYRGTTPIVWHPEAQRVAYEPSAFQNEDASRVNLVMRASPQVVDALNALDERMIDICTQQSAQLFGKTLTQEEVALRYTPCLKKSEKGYEPTFKVKINLTGRSKLRCWNTSQEVCEAPESWVGCSAKPIVNVRCLWIMPKSFGCLLECSNVLINEAQPQCPF
jgi:hypothetical protein